MLRGKFISEASIIEKAIRYILEKNNISIQKDDVAPKYFNGIEVFNLRKDIYIDSVISKGIERLLIKDSYNVLSNKPLAEVTCGCKNKYTKVMPFEKDKNDPTISILECPRCHTTVGIDYHAKNNPEFCGVWDLREQYKRIDMFPVEFR